MMTQKDKEEATFVLILADLAAVIMGIGVAVSGMLLVHKHSLRGLVAAISAFIVGCICLYYLRLFRDLKKGKRENEDI